MTEPTIICPKCKTEIKLTESLAAPLSVQRNPIIADVFNRTGLMAVVGRTNRTQFREGVLKPLMEAGILELTIPNKPRSRRQRYKTTGAGLALIEKELRGEP